MMWEAKRAGRRAVLYLRISDDPEGLGRGVDRQEEDCRAVAAAEGWEVVAVFRENDTSAFKQRTIVLPSGEKVRRVVRPRFRAMLQLMAAGGGDVLIAYDLDRAVRDPRDLEDLIDSKVLHGYGVRSATGSLRLDTDGDVAMARVLVAMANKSSADTARRVARASKQQALDGRWHGGRAPYGYRMADSTLYIVPERATLVREAAERVRAGESVYQVIKAWNAAGIATGSGALWSEKALKQILRNPALKGVRTYRPVMPDGSWATVAEVVTAGNWTPILDANTWDETVAVLDARRAKKDGGRTYSTKRVMPFSGLIRCGKCGHKMRKQGPNYICGHHTRGGCARSINAAQVQDFIEEAVLAAFAGIDLTNTPTRSVGQESVTGLRERLAADRAALEGLDDDHYDGLIDRATWSRQRNRIMDRLTVMQREYEDALPVLPIARVEVGTIVTEWGGRTAAWKHEVTKLVLECVHIHAQPAGVASIVPRRKTDTDQEYQARLHAHRQGLLTQRTEFVWAT